MFDYQGKDTKSERYRQHLGPHLCLKKAMLHPRQVIKPHGSQRRAMYGACRHLVEAGQKEPVISAARTGSFAPTNRFFRSYKPVLSPARRRGGCPKVTWHQPQLPQPAGPATRITKTGTPWQYMMSPYIMCYTVTRHVRITPGDKVQPSPASSCVSR